MNKLYIYIIATVIISAISACSKSNDAKPLETLEKITEIESDDKSLVIELLSDQKLNIGYNTLYFRISDQKNKKEVKNASIKIVPMMEMHMESGAMKHSSPVENPGPSLNEKGLFKATVVFSMASDDHGSWTLEVEIKVSDSPTAQTVIIPVTVLPNKEEKIKTVQFADGSKYMVTFIQPTAPKIGINDFEIVIHQRKNMFEFPAANGFTVKLEPEMPSMGHGSPNNISPILTSSGHYKGKVNFTMSGDWRIHLDLTKENETVNTYFDLTF